MSGDTTITLPLPDHRLTLNRVRTDPHLRATLVTEHKAWATVAGMATIPAASRPCHAADVPLLLIARVERRKRGQRWDTAGMVEALKSYQDGLSGFLYPDDRQIVGYLVLWDERPTGAGLVHLTVRPIAALLSLLTETGR